MNLADLLLKAFDHKRCQGLDYIELRAEEVSQMAIDARETGLEIVSNRREIGHSARVLDDGSWGFAVSSKMTDIPETVVEASRASSAVAGASRQDASVLAKVRPVRRRFDANPLTPLDEVGADVKTGFLKTLCSHISSSDPRISTCKASYRDFTGTRVTATSEGTVVESEVSAIYLMTSVSARDSGVLASARDEIGVTGVGWEHLEKKDTVEAISERVIRRIRQQLEGVPCRPGTYPCVLAPRVVGMLAHEALGHLSEADFFSSGAFSKFEGKKVAPEYVTMVDSPRLEGGFGNVQVDDEGVLPRKVFLIRKGFLEDQMTNREWAARLGRKPTGNARAESYRVPPIIRMRNTYFEPGDMSLDELFEGKKLGYLCLDVRGGQAEANSSFQVGIQECFEIKDGELARPVRDLAISGIAVKSLSLIDGIGKDFGFESSYCGKMGQSCATSDGGPHMSLKKGAIVFGGAG